MNRSVSVPQVTKQFVAVAQTLAANFLRDSSEHVLAGVLFTDYEKREHACVSASL